MAWTDEHPINEYGSLARQCTDKRRYIKRKNAKRSAKSATLEHGIKYTYYLCQICNGYHLTRTRKKGTDQ
jgi:hypothetical protein